MQLCTKLTYIRSLSVGEACFYCLPSGNEMEAINVDRTQLRTSKCSYAEANNNLINITPQKLSSSNIHYIEECYVRPGISEIYCQFTIRIKANSLHPDCCNDATVRQKMTNLALIYSELGGYHELAKRYAKNILLGTWLWRNRDCRELSIEVTDNFGKKITVENSNRLSWYDDDEQFKVSLNYLAIFFEKALSDPTNLYYIDVKAKLTMGWGEEIYPSQKFLDDKIEGEPTKQLKTVRLKNGETTVKLNGQKVGAAIQTIDDWWADNADKPLRVNEYGADREYVIARRHPQNNNDFYTLINNIEDLIEQMKNTSTISNDVHFIMSVLVKGGLYNKTKEKKQNEKTKKS